KYSLLTGRKFPARRGREFAGNPLFEGSILPSRGAFWVPVAGISLQNPRKQGNQRDEFAEDCKHRQLTTLLNFNFLADQPRQELRHLAADFCGRDGCARAIRRIAISTLMAPMAMRSTMA
ncbi:MAG: hypothetical protein KGQ40_08130, partial [Rhodospirillales bacterium]|nr:hypothetical protein [Rhodospirillales bacterium]